LQFKIVRQQTDRNQFRQTRLILKYDDKITDTPIVIAIVFAPFLAVALATRTGIGLARIAVVATPTIVRTLHAAATANVRKIKPLAATTPTNATSPALASSTRATVIPPIGDAFIVPQTRRVSTILVDAVITIAQIIPRAALATILLPGYLVQ